MLSSVLKSQRAVEVNISIMRAFVKMPKMKVETDNFTTYYLYDFLYLLFIE
jgi:hypothetical protein